MTCSKCRSTMVRTSLNYESTGMDNFSVLKDTIFYKCRICGHHHFPKCRNIKRTFVSGQKIKGILVDI